MHDAVMRVILAYKRRVVRKVKRRAPASRLKSRLYYKKHKAKIRLQRKRYINRNKVFLKTRKMFKRTRPSWLNPKKSKTKKKYKAKKSIKKTVIKHKKFHAPKRRKED